MDLIVDSISLYAPPDALLIEIPPDMLSPVTTYSVSVVADSLLGRSPARSVQFVTGSIIIIFANTLML